MRRFARLEFGVVASNNKAAYMGRGKAGGKEREKRKKHEKKQEKNTRKKQEKNTRKRKKWRWSQLTVSDEWWCRRVQSCVVA